MMKVSNGAVKGTHLECVSYYGSYYGCGLKKIIL
jgi:hypothetical protein